MIDIDALFKVQYGMYIVSSKHEDAKSGQIATVVSQVTPDPVQIITCLSKENYTHELIEKSGSFAVSVLDTTAPFKFIGQFGFRSGRDVDKFDNVNYFEATETGCPIVTDHTVMIMDARVKDKLDVGTHTIFLAEVLLAEQLITAEAMTYEYYHTVLRGKSPKNAPTYKGEKS